MFSWNIPIKQEAGLLGYLSDIMSIHLHSWMIPKVSRCTVVMLTLTHSNPNNLSKPETFAEIIIFDIITQELHKTEIDKTKRDSPNEDESLTMSMVPEVGIEPTRSCPRGILSPVRLPVSPLRQSILLSPMPHNYCNNQKITVLLSFVPVCRK